MKNKKSQKGFSLIELLVSVAILLIVSGAVIAGMINTTKSQGTIMNRTQMHAGVRNATELMEQEIGQAGRVTSSPGLQISAITAIGSATPTITATSGTATTGLYVGEQLVVDPNTINEETVTITAVPSTTTVTASFANTHPASTPVLVLGGFASGIVPPDTSSMYIYSGFGTANTTLSTGTSGQASTSKILKLYGDVYGDGNMYYVVYKCDPKDDGTGTLTRYVTATNSDITSSTTTTVSNPGVVLLDNLYNFNNAACFTYQTKDVYVNINGGQVMQTFVVNVAVTLSFQTQNKDAQTNQLQWETKALLNISPRNVFDAWEFASAPSGYTRAQPMPPNVLNNLLTAQLN